MLHVFEKYRTLLFILAGAVALSLFLLFKPSPPQQEPPIAIEAKEPETDASQPAETVSTYDRIFVDIKGQVERPGLYELSPHERVDGVVEMAGGFTKDADRNAVNLALKVSDEMMVYVPKKGEVESPLPPGSPSGTSGGEAVLVNINSATSEEIQTLPGIGPSKAAAFIQYREENGPYRSVDDIKNISGIGEKTFERLKELITVQ
ncbi:helix-hairpin-helix domain-containing protein [Rossellomorea marisflavi]|uniref:helix-hairpin-helix domain-containing protein n=1 Tax=Rossellomorea marisflavi TaxID=189381 RepID=UPI0021CC8377|nr:helix-hairpin-helix domain-containing protein [Rossellomorea marisflavi]